RRKTTSKAVRQRCFKYEECKKLCAIRFSYPDRMDYDRALTSLNNDRTLTHQSAKKLYNAKKNVRFQDTV
ncbi:hypothetical protein PRIPAC_88370, partial [Pristionchus pacificus]|uniref:Uncharacterized protein n=1 Tax=Pristionchus pacificus TaxID=54126 RepID=A0A2A6CV71_PRIPA